MERRAPERHFLFSGCAKIDSRSTFFAPKAHGNACYAGYIATAYFKIVFNGGSRLQIRGRSVSKKNFFGIFRILTRGLQQGVFLERKLFKEVDCQQSLKFSFAKFIVAIPND